jgi:tetratricopeptide (TPR) repeat protein
VRPFEIGALVLLAGISPGYGQQAWEQAHEAGAKAAKQAHFAEAERLLLRSEQEARRAGETSPLLARSLLDLAEVYRTEGKYSGAQPRYEEALKIYTRQYGEESLQVAEVLNKQAEFFKALNDYAEAEALLQRSMEIRQRNRAADSRELAQVQNDLGELYTATGAFEKAEPLLKAALATRQKANTESEDLAQTLEAPRSNCDRSE